MLRTAATLLAMLHPAPLVPVTNPIWLSQIPLKPIIKQVELPKQTTLELAPLPFAPIGTYSNAFPKGQCTYGAASMKGNITWSGNAADWAANARAEGKTVSDVPVVGAVAQHGGGLGHVGVVVGVRPGEILLTEENYDWNGGIRTTWQPVGEYQYIYV